MKSERIIGEWMNNRNKKVCIREEGGRERIFREHLWGQKYSREKKRERRSIHKMHFTMKLLMMRMMSQLYKRCKVGKH